MATPSYQKKAAKRSHPSLTFTQGLAAVRLAKARPWGDNVFWTATDKRNERAYLAAYEAMDFARIVTDADVMAAIDFITEEQVENPRLDEVLSKIRFSRELANMSPAARKAYDQMRRKHLKKAA
jgi:hypothetical protein